MTLQREQADLGLRVSLAFSVVQYYWCSQSDLTLDHLGRGSRSTRSDREDIQAPTWLAVMHVNWHIDYFLTIFRLSFPHLIRLISATCSIT